MISLAQCMGADSSHLTSFQQDHHQFLLHPEVIPAWRKLCSDAETAGFQPKIASAHRSFERQLLIWNEKAAGQRPVLDDEESPLDISTLTDEELVHAILRWSALPGLSRHHWGCEIDIYDTFTKPVDYQLQLTVAETEGHGVFAPFYQWLNKRFERDGEVCGFTRPFMAFGCDVAPEPWHLSFKAVAQQYEQVVNKQVVRSFLLEQDIALKRTVLEQFDVIYKDYVI